MAAVEPLCIPALLHTWAERTPEAPAIAALGSEALTFRHLEQHMRAIVQQLGALGLGGATPHCHGTAQWSGNGRRGFKCGFGCDLCAAQSCLWRAGVSFLF